MGFRHQYVIGDIQGCYADLQALLKQIGFDEKQDKLWFVGDIVARGEDSLSALRLVKRLCQAGAAEMVLGNHDINLIAVWRGVIKIKKKDRTQAIFDAPDCDELLNWLRRQPLLVYPNDKTVMVHAGIRQTGVSPKQPCMRQNCKLSCKVAYGNSIDCCQTCIAIPLFLGQIC